jgi:quercetin dioxygenase-like cupin family protein
MRPKVGNPYTRCRIARIPAASSASDTVSSEEDGVKIHADRRERVVVRSDDLPWVDSPSPGVQRRMLERDGEEVARATSIVRYAPSTRFPAHAHDVGEEFLVLEGIFSDESGDFGAGCYVRNPPGSRHAPHCDSGCTIFVKLRQFDPEDQKFVRVDANAAAWEHREGGIEVLPLHRFRREEVSLVRLPAGASWRGSGGVERRVLEGALRSGADTLDAGTWIRVPSGDRVEATSLGAAKFWAKTGHLPPD